jgi:hypothetical protein
MKVGALDLNEVWCVDFEFSAPPGERPKPVCMVAQEVESGKTLRLWEDDLMEAKKAPFSTGPDCLFVPYYASAEIGCYLALGWHVPALVLDLYTEFRNLTNGKDTPCGSGLLGALVYFGLAAMDVVEKKAMRDLAGRGGPWTAEERQALIDYCESDVVALARLLRRMLPGLDLPRALLRGRYMTAAARMEHAGIPLDNAALVALRQNFGIVQDRLIERIDSDFGVFDGRVFKADRWAQYLLRNRIAWRRLESGKLALDDDTFRVAAYSYPQIEPIRQLRAYLSEMRSVDLAVGTDGRNRCLLSAFRARTSRNQPSNSHFIFGASSWLRGLIRPTEGHGLAYIDWSQQEFGIAAALSQDPAMLDAYLSGDPYLAFAKQAGAVPLTATRATHGFIRDQFKACALAVQYGMGADSLAFRIGQPLFQARELLRLHRETYSKFWNWSDAAVDCAMLHGYLQTVFGWTIRVGGQVNSRSIRNFPMQANGAEMLRLACSLATERKVTVCAPVHDAILIEAPLGELDSAVDRAQRSMAEASKIVLDGFCLRSDAKLVRHPDRFQDERGARMWATVWDVIKDISPAEMNRSLVQECNKTCAPPHTRPILSISPQSVSHE